MEDTICAVSTAPGAGGIAVIRISGPEAIAICNTIFVPRTAGKGLLSQKAYTLRYGSIRRGEELIDEVLIALFRAPHSFTGEDTVEITCHGSVYIQQQIMQLLIERGCRSALPGEYTQRAFMNGKMDLSQAEAVADLIASTSAGQHRIPVAIIGETNAGKSTLLNVLLNEDKAIVSDIHGTTRDVIEDTINIGGITFRFIDTAGIRETHDAIESIGIERTFQKLDQADIVLWMIDAADASLQIAQLSEKILPRSEGKQLILVFNKADLLTDRQFKPTDLPENVQSIFISAKKREHIDKLQDLLIQAAHIPSLSSNDVIVTNIRHYEALTHALESIHRVQEGLSANLSGDFISQDLRECIFHLSDIVGEVTTDQVLGNIFERFCIGK